MKKNIGLLFLIISLAFSANAQNQLDLSKLSTKHQERLSKMSDSRKKARLYKKYLRKDALKKEKQQYKDQLISKSKESVDSDLLPSKDLKDGNAIKKKGEKTISNEIKKHNSNIDINKVNVQQQKQQLKQKTTDKLKNQDLEIGDKNLGKLTDIREVGNVPLDSTKIQNVLLQKGEVLLKNTDEMKLLGKAKTGENFPGLNQQKSQIEKMQSDIKKKALQDKLKKQLTSNANQYIQQNFQHVQQLQSKMTSLKSKYTSLLNSNDMSTAKKRTSLKGEPIWKRVFVGGNFRIPSLDPFQIDFSPQIGYRIDKRFNIGISITYLSELSKGNNGVVEKNKKYGGSLFADLLFYKNYFAYLEGEKLNTVDQEQQKITRSWKESMLLGLGRKFKIAKWLEIQTIFSINLLDAHKNGLFNTPLVIKTGFRIKK